MQINQKLASEICEMRQKELGIAGDYIYITFEELPGTNWDWNADTFG